MSTQRCLFTMPFFSNLLFLLLMISSTQPTIFQDLLASNLSICLPLSLITLHTTIPLICFWIYPSRDCSWKGRKYSMPFLCVLTHHSFRMYILKLSTST
ncbi:hypothetical protein B0H34DRAFT_336954 [Crassisporium funariophilum]|nr:hypothetical protein B0H34DRAFT_336954 [Crassisporium funariophilum]